MTEENATMIKLSRKREVPFCLSCLAVLGTVLLVMARARQSSCISAVTTINRELQNAGFNKSCPILQVTSAKECSTKQQYDRVISSEDFLDGQLAVCSNYIKDTWVPYKDEEKEHPLAFSILAHKDPAQFAK